MERITLKQKAEFFYLRIKLEFSEDNELSPVVMDALTLKTVLVQAMQSLHGQIGAAISIDVLTLKADSMEAIIKVQERSLAKFWSALTLFSWYQERPCALQVVQVSPHLLSLAANSRQWNIEDAIVGLHQN